MEREGGGGREEMLVRLGVWWWFVVLGQILGVYLGGWRVSWICGEVCSVSVLAGVVSAVGCRQVLVVSGMSVGVPVSIRRLPCGSTLMEYIHLREYLREYLRAYLLHTRRMRAAL